MLKEHCLLAQAQLARAVRRRRHLLTETMRDAAHLCFCAIRECKGTRVGFLKVPERASCRARVCILHFSGAHLQGRWDFYTTWTMCVLLFPFGFLERLCDSVRPYGDVNVRPRVDWLSTAGSDVWLTARCVSVDRALP